MFFSFEFGISFPIEIDDNVIEAANDQQCRRLDLVQCGHGQIWTAAAGHHCSNRWSQLRGGLQRRRRTGARAEISDPERFAFLLLH